MADTNDKEETTEAQEALDVPVFWHCECGEEGFVMAAIGWATGATVVHCSCGAELSREGGALTAPAAVVVKVQRPVAGSLGWLVYDEEREHELFLDSEKIPDEVRRLMGSKFKMFLWATLLDEGDGLKFNLITQVGCAPWQEW